MTRAAVLTLRSVVVGRSALMLGLLNAVACSGVIDGSFKAADDTADTTSDAGAIVAADAGAPIDKQQTETDPLPEAPPEPGGPSIAVPACGRATQQAHTVLETRCAGCHGSETGTGGFGSILDVASLVASGKVIPKDPDASPIYKKLASGAMPPASVADRPTSAEVDSLADWITCGAPGWKEPSVEVFAFISIDSRLETVLDDLRSLPNPADRTEMRYLDLTPLANAGFSKEQLQRYREMVAFLVNSLSRGRTAVAPEAIDDDELIYRLDLRDYVWDANTWRQLEQEYPYAAVYDENSRLFPVDETTAERIRDETNTTIPVIQADWFISHASRPPLYYDILDLPGTLPELEADVGVDIDRDIADEDVQRSGFRRSVPSRNNRVIERHEFAGNAGALWRSYDFANNTGRRNIFANLIDFQEDGGEVLFNLDNGLQAYLIVDAAGRRLDKAPLVLIRDPLSRDGAAESGISCISCHQEVGVLPKSDELRDFALLAGGAALFEVVAGLHPDQETMSAVFEDDQDVYLSSLSRLGVSKLDTTTLREIDDTHQGVLSVEDAAAVLGIEASELSRALDASPQNFPADFLSLRGGLEGSGIQRDAFDAVVGDAIEALGLGRPLQVGR